MKKYVLVFLFTIGLITLEVVSGWAQTIDVKERRTRIDMGAFVYAFSEGDDQYGPWWGGRLKVINSPPIWTSGLTGIFEIVAEKHNDTGAETGGVYVVASGYYDWNDNFYTFSSMGLGSDSPLVQFNVHHEIDVKLPPKREVILSLGGGYIDYHGLNNNSYFSLGSAFYMQRTFEHDPQITLQYQFRRYFADPIGEQFNTHILTVEFRRGTRRSTHVRYVHGQEMFRAGGGGTPLYDANLVGRVLTLGHEEQLNDRYGVALRLDFIDKSNELQDRTLFSGTGFELGLFWKM